MRLKFIWFFPFLYFFVYLCLYGRSNISTSLQELSFKWTYVRCIGREKQGVLLKPTGGSCLLHITLPFYLSIYTLFLFFYLSFSITISFSLSFRPSLLLSLCLSPFISLFYFSLFSGADLRGYGRGKSGRIPYRWEREIRYVRISRGSRWSKKRIWKRG